MDKKLSGTLAFVAGFVDTATFMGADGLFSAHVTGNFVLFAAALVRGLAESDFLKLLAFPFFILAVVFATVVYRRFLQVAGSSTSRLVQMEGALLIACGVAFSLPEWTDLPLAPSATLMTVVFAMGLQNAYHRFLPGPAPASTVMTGNVTQLTVETTEMFLKVSAPSAPVEHRRKALEILVSVGFFAAGCLAAGLLTPQWGLGVLLLAGVVLIVTTFRCK